MGYHPRIETKKYKCLLTTRSRNSELWFTNNPELESAILGYAARYITRYSVKLYALAIEGNHVQATAHFPNENRSKFMRDFNSAVAKSVPRYTPEYPGGKFWARRYSNEFLPTHEDIEYYFFYVVLQPVKDGLVDRISEFPGYNCFNDAAWGKTKTFKVVNWGAFNAAKRTSKKASIKDFTETVELKYERLPGYEHLTQKEYAKMLYAKLEYYREHFLKERGDKPAAGREKILRTKRGATPKNTKTSKWNSFRPRVLCKCPVTRRDVLAWYFAIYERFKVCSRKYLAGDLLIEFPPGTYKPHIYAPC